MAETESSVATPAPSSGNAEFDQEARPGKQIQCRVCLRTDGRDLISPCKCEGTSKFVHRECLDYHRAGQGEFAFAHCTTCKVPFYLRAHIHPDRHERILKFLKFRYILFVFAMIQLVTCALANLLLLAVPCLTYRIDLDGHLSYYYVYERFHHDTEFKLCYTFAVLLLCLIVGLSGFLISLYNRRFHNGMARSCQLLPTFCSQTGWRESLGSSENTSFCGFLGESYRIWFELLLIMELSVLGVASLIGIFYGIIVATFLGQLLWRHHYYVSAKRILAKEYVVEDMGGGVKDWCPPLLPPEHVQELTQLGLL